MHLVAQHYWKSILTNSNAILFWSSLILLIVQCSRHFEFRLIKSRDLTVIIEGKGSFSSVKNVYIPVNYMYKSRCIKADSSNNTLAVVDANWFLVGIAIACPVKWSVFNVMFSFTLFTSQEAEIPYKPVP